MQVNVVMSVLLIFVTLSILRIMLNQPWNSNLFPVDSQKVLYNYMFWVNSPNLREYLVLFTFCLFTTGSTRGSWTSSSTCLG